MSKDFVFTTEYALNKAFFAECYDQTSRPTTFPKSYLKGVFFLIFGITILELELLPNGYLGWFFIVLSGVEALSVYYKRAWWLWRQTLSTSSSSKVALQIDADGVTYKSGKKSHTLTWGNINQLEQSDLGFILHVGKQRQYLSKSCLSDEAIQYIVDQLAVSKEK